MSVSRIPIRFIIEGVGNAEGEIVRIRSPRTSDAILRGLPIEGMSALWQEEVYFGIPIKMGSEKSSSAVEQGDLAYWPMGSAFCIFWGETQPYSPVNIIGKVTKNLELFKKVKSGTKIIIEKR
ncbi:cyclophilin-like fold protein [Candidatus Bathyarchaeota archaeon]|nr:cyclophilin-like fold protein [Candidatus Bathyarchaeota archaeon]